MVDREHVVRYKAVADFSSLIAAAARAKAEMAALSKSMSGVSSAANRETSNLSASNLRRTESDRAVTESTVKGVATRISEFQKEVRSKERSASAHVEASRRVESAEKRSADTSLKSIADKIQALQRETRFKERLVSTYVEANRKQESSDRKSASDTLRSISDKTAALQKEARYKENLVASALDADRRQQTSERKTASETLNSIADKAAALQKEARYKERLVSSYVDSNRRQEDSDRKAASASIKAVGDKADALQKEARYKDRLVSSYLDANRRQETSERSSSSAILRSITDKAEALQKEARYKDRLVSSYLEANRRQESSERKSTSDILKNIGSKVDAMQKEAKYKDRLVNSYVDADNRQESADRKTTESMLRGVSSRISAMQKEKDFKERLLSTVPSRTSTDDSSTVRRPGVAGPDASAVRILRDTTKETDNLSAATERLAARIRSNNRNSSAFGTAMRVGLVGASVELEKVIKRTDHSVSAFARLTAAARGFSRAAGGGGGGGGIFSTLIGGFGEFGRASQGFLGHLAKIPKALGLTRSAAALATSALTLLGAAGGVASTIGAVAPVALAAANALQALAGVAGLLPGLLASVGVGFGALIVAITPVLNVFKAYMAAQGQVAKGDASAAKSRESSSKQLKTALKGVQDAEQGLTDARANAVEVAQSSARSISDAEQAVQDARENASEVTKQSARSIKDAEQGVADARQAAADSAHESAARIADAESAVADARANVAETARDVARRIVEAEKNVSDARQNAADVAKDVAKRIKSAEADVADARLASVDTAKEVAKRIKDAEDAVTEARTAQAEQVRETAKRINDAEVALTEARAARVDQIRETAKNIMSAEQDVSDALDAQMQQTVQSQRSLDDALNNLLEARTQAVDDYQKALDDVKSAEQDYADARKDQINAEHDLVDARKEATRALEDLRDAVTAGALDEEGAQIHLRRAQLELNRSSRDGTKAQLERASALDTVRQAEQDLEDAQLQASRSSQSIEEAQNKLSRAQEEYEKLLQSGKASALDRAEALNKVRDAENDIADAKQEALRKEEGVEAARNQLEETKIQVNSQVEDSDLSRAEAVLKVKEAHANLSEIQKKNTRTQDELNDANSKGVEGSKQVVGAQKNLEDANNKVLGTQQALVAARENVTKQQIESNKKIAEAERQLSDARGAALKGEEDAQRRVVEALAKLSEARLQGEKAARESNKRVVDAQEALNEARRRGEKDLLDSNNRVIKAQEALAEARVKGERDQAASNKRVVDAQVALNDARARGDKEQLDANKKIIEAQEALAETRRKGEQEQADANKRLIEAQKGLNEAHQQAVKDQTDANRRIVESQQALVDAKIQAEKDQRDANRRIQDSEQALADTRREAEKANLDANKRILEAQARVTDAYEKVAEANAQVAEAQDKTTNAMSKYQSMLEKLSPSQRKFFLGLVAMKDQLKDIQTRVGEGVFGPLVQDLPKIKGFLPVINALLGSAADVIGNITHKGIAMVTSGPWTSDFKTLAKANTGILTGLGNAALRMLDGFRNFGVASLPAVKELVTYVGQLASQFQDFTKKARDNGALAAFFKDSLGKFKTMVEIVKNLGSAIFHVASTSGDFTNKLLASVEKTTQKWADYAIAQDKATSPLKTYLVNIQPLLHAVAALIGQVFKDFASAASNPRNIQHAIDLLTQLKDKVLPAVVRLFGQLSSTGVDTKVLDALTDSIAGLTSVLEHGGTSAMSGFVNVLGFAAKAFAAIARNRIAGPILGVVSQAVGGLAAAALVSKLTGLTSIIKFIGFLIANKGQIPSAVVSKIIGPTTDATKAKTSLDHFSASLRNVGTAAEPAGKNIAAFTDKIKGPFGTSIAGSSRHVTALATAMQKINPAFVEAATGATKQASLFNKATSGMNTGISKMRTAIGGLSGALGGPWGLALSAAAVLIGVFAVKSAEASAKQRELKSAAADVGQAIAENNNKIDDSIKKQAAKNLADDGALDIAKQLGISLSDVTAAYLGNVEALERIKKAAEGYAQVIRDNPNSQEADEARKKLALYEKLIGSLELAGAATDEAKKKYKLYQEALGSTADAEKATESQKKVAAAVAVLRDNASSATDKLKALKDIQDELAGSAKTLRETDEAAAAAKINLTKTIKDNGTSLKTNTEAGLKNRDAIEARVESLQDQYAANIASGKSEKDSKKIYEDGIQTIYDTVGALKGHNSQLDELIKSEGEIPSKITTTLVLSGFKPGSDKFDDLKKKAQELVDTLGYSPEFAAGIAASEGKTRTTAQARGQDQKLFKADGGYIEGPGSGTSDSIPARLSNGEFVVNAKSTAQHLPLLHSINSGGRGYASGGYVFPDGSRGFAKGGQALGQSLAGTSAIILKVSGQGDTALDSFRDVSRQTTIIWKGIIDTVKNSIGSIPGAIATPIKQVKSTITDAFNSIGRTISGVVSKIPKAVGDAVGGIKTSVSRAFNALPAVVKDSVGDIQKSVTAGFNKVRDFIKNILKGIQDRVSDWWDSLTDKFTNAQKALLLKWSQFWGKIKNTVIDTAIAIQNKLIGWYTTLTRVFTDGQESISRHWSSFWSGTKKTASDTLTAISRTVSDKMNLIKTTMDTVLNKIKGAFGKVYGELAHIVSVAMNNTVATMGRGWDAVTDKVNKGILAVNSITSKFGFDISKWQIPKIGSAGGISAPKTVLGHGLASGGHVTGPGGETEDKIPAWLSHNEYVVKAASVRKLGVDTLDHLNKTGEMPGKWKKDWNWGGDHNWREGHWDWKHHNRHHNRHWDHDKKWDNPRDWHDGKHDHDKGDRKYATGGLVTGDGRPRLATGGSISAAAKAVTAAVKPLAGLGSGGTSINRIIAIARNNGFGREANSVTSTFRPGDPGYHGQGKAVDFGGYNQTRFADFWLRNGGGLLELIHQSTSGRRWAVKKGIAGYQGYNSLFSSSDDSTAHRNHVHVAMNADARLGPPAAGSGGVLGFLFDVLGAMKKIKSAFTSKILGPIPMKPPFQGGAVKGILNTGKEKLFSFLKAKAEKFAATTGGDTAQGTGGVDMNVVTKAYAAAKASGANNKVLLALFEAGLVESNFRNLGNLGASNDFDSLGYLQQRPSQGWPNPMNIAVATNSFVRRAMAKRAATGGGTAGQLAQSVQVSAFPARYDQRRTDAISLLHKMNPSYVAGNYAKGGLVSKVGAAAGGLLRDHGGALNTGKTLVDNRSGFMEGILSPRGLDAVGGMSGLQALNSGLYSFAHGDIIPKYNFAASAPRTYSGSGNHNCDRMQRGSGKQIVVHQTVHALPGMNASEFANYANQRLTRAVITGTSSLTQPTGK